MSNIDLNALAASLATTARHLGDHVEARAQEIAEPQILAAQLAAKAQMDEQDRQTKFEMQRKSDLIAELRRQLNAQVRQCERQHTEIKGFRDAIRRVEELQVWTNEDRKRFVFAEELWAALAETGSPATRAYAELQRDRAERLASSATDKKEG